MILNIVILYRHKSQIVVMEACIEQMHGKNPWYESPNIILFLQNTVMLCFASWYALHGMK